MLRLLRPSSAEREALLALWDQAHRVGQSPSAPAAAKAEPAPEETLLMRYYDSTSAFYAALETQALQAENVVRGHLRAKGSSDGV
jgi:hypothetical protein